MRNNQKLVLLGSETAIVDEQHTDITTLRFTADNLFDQTKRYDRTDDMFTDGWHGWVEDTVWKGFKDPKKIYLPALRFGGPYQMMTTEANTWLRMLSEIPKDFSTLYLDAQPQFGMDASKGHKKFTVTLKSNVIYDNVDPGDEIIGAYNLFQIGIPSGDLQLVVQVEDFKDTQTLKILAWDTARKLYTTETVLTVSRVDLADAFRTYTLSYEGTQVVLDVHDATGKSLGRLVLPEIKPYDDKGLSAMVMLSRNGYDVGNERQVSVAELSVERGEK